MKINKLLTSLITITIVVTTNYCQLHSQSVAVIDEIGSNGVSLIKNKLKEPFLTLLSSSEFISSSELNHRIKDVEDGIKNFKNDFKMVTEPVSIEKSIQSEVPTTPAPAEISTKTEQNNLPIQQQVPIIQQTNVEKITPEIAIVPTPTLPAIFTPASEKTSPAQTINPETILIEKTSVISTENPLPIEQKIQTATNPAIVEKNNDSKNLEDKPIVPIQPLLSDHLSDQTSTVVSAMPVA